jgi:hypothetical protein
VRDRVGEGSERIRFSSAILPPYALRSKNLEVLIPILTIEKVSHAPARKVIRNIRGGAVGGRVWAPVRLEVIRMRSELDPFGPEHDLRRV